MANMADDENSDLKCLKNTRITVLVDEALPDILVVTYEYGVRTFKGVLLDANKRNLPFGIQALNPALSPPKKLKPEDDPLYAVNQRFTYTDPNNAKNKKIQLPSKYKNNRMTVRLRPRQVLCSKCKGICNENSENVSRKRKSSETTQVSSVPIKRGLNAPITRSVYTEQLNTSRKNAVRKGSKGASLVPKLTRLTAEQEQRALSGNFNDRLAKKPLGIVSNLNSSENQQKNDNIKHSDTDHSEHSSSSSGGCDENQSDPLALLETKPIRATLRVGKRQLRKKQSTVSIEELWDETASEENANKNIDDVVSDVVTNGDSSNVHTNTRTIKISYGPQGEGTVLKIPAKIDSLESKGDSEENINIEEEKNKDIRTKEARRALKRAKREAKRRVLLPTNSPCYLGGASPRYAVPGSSPRYTVGSASPRHGLGNNSPRYICTSLEVNMPRRRKHKMKHKKKHRENKDRKHKDGEVSSSTQDELKEQCSTQKLSINLKRLQSRYTSNDTKEDNSSGSDDQSEQVPDFPPSNQPLMLRINAQAVSSASGADGARLLVGDVVWGKIHGFPWWPGKILTITNCNNRDFQAHVSWYGSSTSSLMQCDQLSPYLEHFKIRYNKKKRGPYKEAIKQASNEARENAESKARQPLRNSPSHNLISQVVPPALASPREIDVAS
ncbi:hypothetical protein HHI36_016217 [Cryptolaemus montrouzieri]|uniref:PWWP domain-containing protein n=1 Tax=Cryptolaemus montrouzieri TaxID=559131 RepID=A0ABD2NJH2_9CUCU